MLLVRRVAGPAVKDPTIPRRTAAAVLACAFGKDRVSRKEDI
jgi:hypothetical protein